MLSTSLVDSNTAANIKEQWDESVALFTFGSDRPKLFDHLSSKFTAGCHKEHKHKSVQMQDLSAEV